jgi:hypothetical protein
MRGLRMFGKKSTGYTLSAGNARLTREKLGKQINFYK